MNKKQFIVVAGIDGSGKTTLIKELINLNKEIVISHWTIFENVLDKKFDDLNISNGEIIKNLSPFTRTSLFLYIFGLQLDKIIKPNLDANKIVIADSYWYKCAAKIKASNQGNPLLLIAFESLLKPDKIIFIDTNPETAYDRKKTFNHFESNGKSENFIPFQRNIRDELLKRIREEKNVLMLNGSKPLLDNLKEATNFIYN